MQSPTSRSGTAVPAVAVVSSGSRSSGSVSSGSASSCSVPASGFAPGSPVYAPSKGSDVPGPATGFSVSAPSAYGLPSDGWSDGAAGPASSAVMPSGSASTGGTTDRMTDTTPCGSDDAYVGAATTASASPTAPTTPTVTAPSAKSRACTDALRARRKLPVPLASAVRIESTSAGTASGQKNRNAATTQPMRVGEGPVGVSSGSAGPVVWASGAAASWSDSSPTGSVSWPTGSASVPSGAASVSSESVSASVSESVSLSASPADSSDRPSAAPPAGPAASSAVGPSSSGPVPSPRLRSVSAMVPDRSGAGFAGESRSTSSDAIIRQPSGGRGTAAGPHSRKECGPVPRTGRSGLLLGLRIGRSGAVVVPGRRRRRLGAGQCDGG